MLRLAVSGRIVRTEPPIYCGNWRELGRIMVFYTLFGVSENCRQRLRHRAMSTFLEI